MITFFVGVVVGWLLTVLSAYVGIIVVSSKLDKDDIDV